MFELSFVQLGSGAIQGSIPLTTDLLASLYVAPRAQPQSGAKIIAETVGGMPWEESFKVAQGETVAAVERMLALVMCSTADLNPASIKLDGLSPGSRVHQHLAALKSLWQNHPEIMPAELQVMRHIIGASPEDAIQPLTIIYDHDNHRLSPAELSVVQTLERHHGQTPADDALIEELIRRPRRASADETGFLGQVQRHMLDKGPVKTTRDDSLHVLSVRDALQEAEVAAGIVQTLLAQDDTLAASDIAILIPDASHYAAYLEEAFTLAGMPLSGLPGRTEIRDLGLEVVLHFLLSRRKPAPAMALASLFSLQLMPWPAETGQLLANCIIQRDFKPEAAKQLTGKAERLYKLIRADMPQSPQQLAHELDQLGKSLTTDTAFADAVTQAKSHLADLGMALVSQPQGTDISWDEIIRSLPANGALPAMRQPRIIGAVSVLTADERPRRRYRHMMVLGFNDGRYPAPPSGNAFFLDSEIALINEHCGIKLKSQADILGERLELFSDQIAAASDRLILLVSSRDRDGKSLSPSASLALIARLAKDVKDPEEMILDLNAAGEEEWLAFIPRIVTAPPARLAALTIPEYLDLGRNLLELRLDEKGQPKRQSPSRLETLIVSPLAWLLNELDAVPAWWEPETLDALLKGSLAHEVFEHLFLPMQSLPSDTEIEEKLPEIFNDRIRQIAPFLQSSSWTLERRTLEAEITRSALGWAHTLRTLDAEIIGNEFWLSGLIFDVPVHGKVDCLIRINGAQLVIVDHKKSSTKKRRQRLEAGWDLQVDLYRNMTVRAKPDDNAEVIHIRSCIEASARPPGVAYHLMNDEGVLINGIDQIDVAPPVVLITEDIASEARKQLNACFFDLRSGIIRLNRSQDPKFFDKEAHMGPYAFEASPLIRAFILPAGDGSEEDINDD